jgi:predicted secreted hydrolase
MSRRLGWLLLVFAIAGAASLSYLRRRAPGVAGGGAWILLASPSPGPSFARAMAPVPFRWPEDQGAHFFYRTEWWYYTGNLEADDGRAFGYQLTIFRRGLTPGPPPSGSSLATNQVYLAHFAVTDAGRGTHVASERWSRGAAELAGVDAWPFRAFVEDWVAEASNPDGSHLRLRAHEGQNAIDLTLERTKALVLQGDQGLSAKSEEPGNASYYVSETRLGTRGVLVSMGEAVSVSGESWFDHEWSTSALAADAVGWDWLSLQLGDGYELMLFRIRRGDGASDPASSGTLVSPSGATRRLGPRDVDLQSLDSWVSPRSGARYPSRLRIDIPNCALELTVSPLVRDQEVDLSFTYWEGAVRVTGRHWGLPVAGKGYVELTGYAKPLRKLF